MVRTLERVWVQQQALLGQEHQRQALMRTMSCYNRGYLLVNATHAGLSLIHMNTAACHQLSASPNGLPSPHRCIFGLDVLVFPVRVLAFRLSLTHTNPAAMSTAECVL